MVDKRSVRVPLSARPAAMIDWTSGRYISAIRVVPEVERGSREVGWRIYQGESSPDI
jgi:hypothetical protein